jgi:hypothetical protein
MILSHKWRFIFIKGLKVGGTSVEMALSPACGPDDVVTPITSRDEIERIKKGGVCRNFAADHAFERAYHAKLYDFIANGDSDWTRLPDAPSAGNIQYYNHMPLRNVLQQSGIDHTKFKIFAIERSPYFKILSYLNFAIAKKAYQAGNELRADLHDIKESIEPAIRDGTVNRVKNVYRYCGANGRLAATVLRYSQLGDDFQKIVSELKIEPIPELPHAKKSHMFDMHDPREFFSTEQIAIINRVFADEFRLFGYQQF